MTHAELREKYAALFAEQQQELLEERWSRGGRRSLRGNEVKTHEPRNTQSDTGVIYQQCGGGRRVIRKKIGGS